MRWLLISVLSWSLRRVARGLTTPLPHELFFWNLIPRQAGLWCSALRQSLRVQNGNALLSHCIHLGVMVTLESEPLCRFPCVLILRFFAQLLGTCDPLMCAMVDLVPATSA